MSVVTSPYPTAANAGELARRTTFGVIVGLVAVLAVRVVVGLLSLDVGVSGPQTPFAFVPILTVTVVAGAVAAVAYAALVRFTSRPVRNFVGLSAAVFVFMMAPVVSVAPALGITLVGQAVLTVFHLLVGASIVAFVIGAVEL